MKLGRYLIATLIWLSVVLPPAKGQSFRGHEIRVTLKDYRDTLAYLGYYFGAQTYVLDSARLNGAGTGVFKGDTALSGGIYFILCPDKHHYFEMLLDQEQHFNVIADTADGMRHVAFEHSPDNTQFSAYNAFLRTAQQQMTDARQDGMDSIQLSSLQQKIGDDITHYREKFVHDHPETMLAMIFRGMRDPQVPETGKLGKDSASALHYFKDHYWDQIDFSDARILRTPVLETRLQRYFSQMVVPVADSINAAADTLLVRAKTNAEVFKFVLWWLTHTYETSPYMGMDAVFVHLVEKYYMTGEAYWLTQDQTQKIVDRAAQIAPNLIGNTAPDLALKTPDLKPLSLAAIKAKYLLVVFWDPTCGHCQVEIPQLDSAWQHHWKQMGMQMLGVLSGGTQSQWQDFIRDHHLQGWIHAWDPEAATNYRRLYDVYMTPVVYLLDEHKKIVAKKLGVDQIDAFLGHLSKSPAANP